jgi:hypothetical protein
MAAPAMICSMRVGFEYIGTILQKEQFVGYGTKSETWDVSYEIRVRI